MMEDESRHERKRYGVQVLTRYKQGPVTIKDFDGLMDCVDRSDDPRRRMN